MIAAFATDDLALFRRAFGGMVIPDYLYGGVICLGTRRSELNLAHLAVAPCWWRRFYQHFCKVNCRIDGLSRKAVIKRQGPQLCNGCLDELRFGKAKRCAPKPAHPFIEFLAIVIMHKHAVTARHDMRSRLA